jgi:ABC-2 type transport system ATP-binding protein
MILLQADHVSKSYASMKAVDGVSLQVRAGEIVGLLGRNGAGKTSLLNCLVGLSRSDAGVVLVDEQNIAENPMSAKSSLAFVADTTEFFEYLTVQDHIELALELAGLPESLTNVILAESGLTEKREISPRALSRGEQQMLLLRLALVRRPKVLVLDEPLTGLDPVVAADARRLIVSAAAAGAAVLFSSHLLSAVASMCSRVVLMRGGKLVVDRAIEGMSAEELEKHFLEEFRDVA